MYFTDCLLPWPGCPRIVPSVRLDAAPRGRQMKVRGSTEIAVALVAALATLDASASVVEKSTRAGGFDVQYKVILPDGYDAAKAYPAVLVMGGGPQTMSTVDGTLERN